MGDFDALIGTWHGEGEMPIDPPVTLVVDSTIERLGEFIVMRTAGVPAEMPNTLSIIGGAPDGEPQPMHYFDSRGVKRMFLMTLEGSTWIIWRDPGEDWNGPDGPGFNQRFIGETVRRRQHDRWPLGAWHGRGRRRMGARLPADLHPHLGRPGPGQRTSSETLTVIAAERTLRS